MILSLWALPGKSQIVYVDSKSDARYLSYIDSLNKYNEHQRWKAYAYKCLYNAKTYADFEKEVNRLGFENKYSKGDDIADGSIDFSHLYTAIFKSGRERTIMVEIVRKPVVSVIYKPVRKYRVAYDTSRVNIDSNLKIVYGRERNGTFSPDSNKKLTFTSTSVIIKTHANGK